RVPFLDLSLYENREEYRRVSIEKKETKYILKNVLLKFLPRHYIYRPKSGMGLPMKKLFSESEVLNEDFDLAVAYLSKDPRIKKYLPKDNNFSKVHEPYFCYMLVTLYLTLKNLKYEA